MKILLMLGIIGIIILGYSISMEPYTNREEFLRKTIQLDRGMDTEFYNIRDEMLTPKYRLQDTGITLILFSIFLGTFVKFHDGKFLSPKTKRSLIGIAIFLPFLTVAGYIFDIFQGMSRDEFPHWADSIGIPLMSTPFILCLLIIWAIFHLAYIKNYKKLPLSVAFTRKLNPWLLIVSILTAISTLYSIFYGQYWYALPGILWLYYYLSLGVNYIHEKKNKDNFERKNENTTIPLINTH